MSALQPLVDFLESVKFQVDGVAVTGKATLKDPGKFLSTFTMEMFRPIPAPNVRTLQAVPPGQ